MKEFLFQIIIFPVRLYQLILSPIIGPACRYEPTCSHYFIQALRTQGLRKGFFLGVKRLLSCHPWGGKGFDPVPTNDVSQSSSPQPKSS